MKQLPNYFTLLNLFCGCMAIVYALQPGETIALQQGEDLLYQLPERLMIAPFWLMAAGFIDFLDGFLARWMKAESPLGAQLDSLSDVVSFGVAPSIFLYQLLRISFLRETGAIDISLIWLLPAFLFAMAAAWRLAVFNLDTEQRYSFKGVPTPVSALVVASLPLVYWFDDWKMGDWVLNKWVLYGLVLLLSWLMVSRFPIMSLKVKDRSGKGMLPQIVFLCVTLCLILFLHWLAIPLIYILLLVLSLVFRKQIA